jgi:hypothetical protein
VPDDRFADLGGGTRAGDRLADLDEREPTPQPPRRRASYTWVVGVAAVILIAVVALNTFDDPRQGRSGPPIGEPIPRFAAPAAGSGLEFDANVNQTASDPAPGDTPACDVSDEGALRSCDYTSKPLVLTLIVPTAECEDFVDRVERLRERHPRVNFVTVISGQPKEADKAVAKRGWGQPVALDRNGDILTRFRLGLCPNVIVASKGGIVRDVKTADEKWTDAQLSAAIERVERR